tara:strand:+ start:384 stop:662 length:279 start_codon:yes stop_codon:yes gene_type:complete
MIKLKELLNENDLKGVKSQLKHLDEYLKSKEKALKKYKKYYEMIRKNPKNIDVDMAETLLEKHRDLVTLSFTKQTHFTIENLIKDVKELENA